MIIYDYNQWMKDTHSLLSSRSDFLKQLDEAIRVNHKDAIKNAFDRWRFEQSKQGKDWKKSTRNDKGALTKLYRLLYPDKRNFSPEELEALKFISESQKYALLQTFLGKRVEFKSSTLIGLKNSTATKFQQFKTSASTLIAAKSTVSSGHTVVTQAHKAVDLIAAGKSLGTNAAQQAKIINFESSLKLHIQQLIDKICPGTHVDAIFSALGLDSLTHFASDIAPFLGVVKSGGAMILDWISVASTAWDRHNVGNKRFAIHAGDPEAAFDAILVLLDRDILSKSAHATMNSVAFAGQTAGAFLDFGAATGPVIGAMKLLYEIIQTVIGYLHDMAECKKANNLLQIGALDLNLFTVCPTLGCYFLVIQDHSTIINFVVADYGTANWMFDVENLVKKIEPVLAKAQQYIHESRLEIPGMQHCKGIVKQNWSNKSMGLGKIIAAPGALKDEIFDQIGNAITGKHAKTLTAEQKKRIQGQGFDGTKEWHT